MFENIGGKIKALTKTIFVVSLILFLIGGLIAAISIGKIAAVSCVDHRYEQNTSAGIFTGIGIFIGIAAVGFLVSWISSFFMYGYGQLIADVSKVRDEVIEIKSKNVSTLCEGKMGNNESKKDFEKTERQGKEDTANQIAFEMQKQMGIAAPVDSPTFEEKPVKKEIKTLSEMLEYAGKFTTDEGMINYCKREIGNLSEKERAKVEGLLRLSPGEMRTAIKEMTEKA